MWAQQRGHRGRGPLVWLILAICLGLGTFVVCLDRGWLTVVAWTYE